MKKYYIYHIPGVKIGVSTEPNKRVKDQGYTEYDILEKHTDIYLVSDREQELQKEYGYKVDKNPYYTSKRNRRKWTKEDSDKARKVMLENGFFKEWYKKGNASRRKGCIALDKETLEPIKEFKSISDAVRWLGKGSTSALARGCKNIKLSYYGYRWKYKD